MKNTGKVTGDEATQLYLVAPKAGNAGLSAKLQLEGFQRVTLKPGESRKLTFILTPRELSEVDASGMRSVQAGEYSIAIGGAQPGDPLAPAPAQTLSFRIEGDIALAR